MRSQQQESQQQLLLDEKDDSMVAMNVPAVVSSNYCVADTATTVQVVKKGCRLSGCSFKVLDSQEVPVLTVEGPPLSLTAKRVMRDATGKTLVSLNRKVLNLHRTWQAYLGDRVAGSQPLFTMKRASVLNICASYNIYTQRDNSDDHHAADFTVKGNFWKRDFSILYSGQPVAKVSRKFSIIKSLLGKEKYVATVSPGTDYAFIAAVIVIMDGQRRPTSRS